MGAATMSGLTLTALVNLTFTDEGAPDAAGELQRHGNDLKWYGASVVNLTAADASAGTASLRTLGTTSVKAAAGNHTHQVSSAASGSSSLAVVYATSSETDIVSHSATPGATNRGWAIFAGAHPRDGGDTYTFKLYFESTLLETVTGVTATNIRVLSGFQENPAVSSQTIKLTAQRTAGASDSYIDAYIVFREVTI
jgi:hypothetical protein